ncbi:MAG: tetratricopeptide repeat protein [Bdellovibrionales bacterium]
MSALLKAHFDLSSPAPARAVPPDAPVSPARVIPLVTYRPEPPKPDRRWVPLAIYAVLAVLWTGIWYGNQLGVLRMPKLDAELMLPDPESIPSYAETIIPPPADVVVPRPVLPPASDSPTRIADFSFDTSVPKAGILLPVPSDMASTSIMPAPEKSPVVAVQKSYAAGEEKVADPEKHAARIDVRNPEAALADALRDAEAGMKAGNPQAALALYNRILKNDRNNRAALAGKSMAAQRAGKYKLAVDSARRLLALEPKNEAVRTNLVAMLGAWGTPDAVKELQRMVKKEPKYARAHSMLGQMLVRRNTPLKALPYARRAAKLEPENLVYRLNLAITYDQLGRSNEAVPLYKDVLIRFDENDDVPNLPVPPGAIQERVTYLEELMTSAQTMASTDE